MCGDMRPVRRKGRRIWYRQLHGMGGRQKALREEVLARFPLYYERYIEVFGGGGWVLFHKPPGTDFEVYNDLNGNLAALYRTVRDHPRELQERLRYVLNSREDFMRLKQVLEHPEGWRKWRAPRRFTRSSGTATRQAAAALRRSRTACGELPLIDKACARLQKVVVENKDFGKLIRQYDRPVSFFLLRPAVCRHRGLLRQHHLWPWGPRTPAGHAAVGAGQVPAVVQRPSSGMGNV